MRSKNCVWVFESSRRQSDEKIVSFECTVCGAKKTVVIDANENYGDYRPASQPIVKCETRISENRKVR